MRVASFVLPLALLAATAAVSRDGIHHVPTFIVVRGGGIESPGPSGR